MHIILLIISLIIGTALYKAIKSWYIVPLEEIRLKLEIDTKSFNNVLKSKNELINKLSIENAELLKQVRLLKKKTSKKILEKFDLNTVK